VGSWITPLPVCVEVVGPELARQAVLALLAEMPEVSLGPLDLEADEEQVLVLMRLRDAASFPHYDWAHGVLIAGGEPEELLEAAALGIVVFVHAADDSDKLIEALQAAVHGRPYTTPRLSIPIIRALQLAAAPHPTDPHGVSPEALARLTPVERRVSACVAHGMQNRQVAAALGLKDRAVKLHLMSVFRKLGIGSRRELVPLLTTLEAEGPASRPEHGPGGGSVHGPPGAKLGDSDPLDNPGRWETARSWAIAADRRRDPV
jgi:DNA-binding NarL/FixJ family response regulator